MKTIVLSFAATVSPEMKGVICTLIPVFRTAPEPFGRTNKELEGSGTGGGGCELAAGSIFTTARASYFPSATTVKSL